MQASNPWHHAARKRGRCLTTLAPLFGLVLLAGCNAGESDPDPGEITRPSVPTLYRGRIAVGMTGDARSPAVALGTDGSSIAVQADPVSGRLVGGMIGGTGRMPVRVEPDSNGFPARMVVGNNAILFANWRADRVDLAFVDSAGRATVRRDVPIPEGARRYRAAIAAARSGEYFRASLRVANAGSPSPSIAARDPAATAAYLRLVASTGGLATCMGTALGWVPTPATPLLLTTFAASCASSVVDLVSQVRGEEVPALWQTVSLVSTLAGAHGCVARAEECLQAVASTLSLAADVVAAWSRARDAELVLARGALSLGGGAVQITLTWQSTADIDLYVTDPRGSVISYSRPSSASGGRLDRDDTDGFGPENIFWPSNGAPAGTYRVRVQHFSGALPTTFSVLVSTGGESRRYTGTLTRSVSAVDVVTFTLGQPLPLVARGELVSISRAPAKRVAGAAH